jgi:hypothetical protein
MYHTGLGFHPLLYITRLPLFSASSELNRRRHLLRGSSNICFPRFEPNSRNQGTSPLFMAAYEAKNESIEHVGPRNEDQVYYQRD